MKNIQSKWAWGLKVGSEIGAENLQLLQRAAPISLLPALRELSYWKVIVILY
jgi:hypothetical protein